MPKGLKIPPIEQRKKRGFCKFHDYLGHNTSHCGSFRDSVQKALDEGRLKFGDKSNKPMQIDADLLKQTDFMYVEVVDVNIIETAESVAESLVNPKMLTIIKRRMWRWLLRTIFARTKWLLKNNMQKKMKVAYPTSVEDLVDFTKRCKISNSTTMLCPRCSVVFDKEAARNIEGFRPKSKRKGKWVDKKPKCDFNKSEMKTFTPLSRSPAEKRVFSGGKKSNYIAPPTKWVKRVTSSNASKETSDSNKFVDNNNYKGKNPMTKTQWSRFQRQKKADVLKDITNIEKGKEKEVAAFKIIRKPATERIFPPLSTMKENLTKYDDEMTSNFNSSESDFYFICVGAILPVKHDVTSEITEDEGDFTEEMTVHKPLCYYVMDNGCGEG